MVKLQITNCKNCGKDYLVGIDGKDIRQSETSGGEYDRIPFMAIGNEEMEEAPILANDKIPCKNCGILCELKNFGHIER